MPGLLVGQYQLAGGVQLRILNPPFCWSIIHFFQNPFANLLHCCWCTDQSDFPKPKPTWPKGAQSFLHIQTPTLEHLMIPAVTPSSTRTHLLCCSVEVIQVVCTNPMLRFFLHAFCGDRCRRMLGACCSSGPCGRGGCMVCSIHSGRPVCNG